MTINTTQWDSAEYLKTEEDVQLYLEACLEEAGDDPIFIAHALGVINRAKKLNDRPVSRLVPDHEEKPSMFGRDRHKIRILGDIIEPIGVTWEAEMGKTWEREDDNHGYPKSPH